jgi:hypothetical protein
VEWYDIQPSAVTDISGKQKTFSIRHKYKNHKRKFILASGDIAMLCCTVNTAFTEKITLHITMSVATSQP